MKFAILFIPQNICAFTVVDIEHHNSYNQSFQIATRVSNILPVYTISVLMHWY